MLSGVCVVCWRCVGELGSGVDGRVVGGAVGIILIESEVNIFKGMFVFSSH